MLYSRHFLSYEPTKDFGCIITVERRPTWLGRLLRRKSATERYRWDWSWHNADTGREIPYSLGGNDLAIWLYGYKTQEEWRLKDSK